MIDKIKGKVKPYHMNTVRAGADEVTEGIKMEEQF